MGTKGLWQLKISQSTSGDTENKVQKAFKDLRSQSGLGFQSLVRLQESMEEAKKYRSFIDQYNKLVVVGVGGSSLGTKAISQALFPNHWPEKLIFLDNADTSTVDRFLNSENSFDQYGWVVCSKSGSTIETLSLFEYCHAAIAEQYNFSIIKNSLVISEDKQSPLVDYAQKNQVLHALMPKDVGGRFSVFTPIGLLPLQALDFDFTKVKSGFENALNNSSLVCELSGFLYESIQKGETSFYSFQYCDGLESWGLWLQQLWSESLSKKSTRNGDQAPVVHTFIPCRGASDQHSVLQQVIEGHESKVVGFHRVLSSEKSQYQIKEPLFSNSLLKSKGLGHLIHAELIATEQAVRDSGRDTFVMSTEKLDEESLSSLMMVWMLCIGVLGELLDINAFDQPGVESGKVIARRVLSQAD